MTALITIEHSPLTAPETERRDQLVGVVKHGFETFIEVGEAMYELRESRLYRETHDTFDAFSRDVLGITKSHANRMITAARVVASLPPGLPAPSTESQARELAAIADPDERAEIWADVSSAGKPTAAAIKQAKDDRPTLYQMMEVGDRYSAIHWTLFGEKAPWSARSNTADPIKVTLRTWSEVVSTIEAWEEQERQRAANLMGQVVTPPPAPSPEVISEALLMRLRALGGVIISSEVVKGETVHQFTRRGAIFKSLHQYMEHCITLLEEAEGKGKPKAEPVTSLTDELLDLPDQPAGWGWEIDRKSPYRRYRLVQQRGGNACTNWYQMPQEVLDEVIEGGAAVQVMAPIGARTAPDPELVHTAYRTFRGLVDEWVHDGSTLATILADQLPNTTNTYLADVLWIRLWPSVMSDAANRQRQRILELLNVVEVEA